MLFRSHIIPAHGHLKMTAGYTDFATEMGYTAQSTVHMLKNGQRVKLN